MGHTKKKKERKRLNTYAPKKQTNKTNKQHKQHKQTNKTNKQHKQYKQHKQHKQTTQTTETNNTNTNKQTNKQHKHVIEAIDLLKLDHLSFHGHCTIKKCKFININIFFFLANLANVVGRADHNLTPLITTKLWTDSVQGIILMSHPSSRS